MFQDSENDNTEGGRRLREESQRRWSERWKLFAPRPGETRKTRFYVDLPTMLLALLVGCPVGAVVTERLTGQQALGGIVGFLVLMVVLGYFRQRMGTGGGGGTVRGPASIARATLAGAAVFGLLGLWFAASEGDLDYGTAAMRFGAIGAVPGFLVGLVRARAGRRAD